MEVNQIYMAFLISIAVLSQCVICESNYPKCAIKLDLNICYTMQPVNFTPPEVCNQSYVCRKKYQISHIYLEPYSQEIVTDLMKLCCGTCVTAPQVQELKKVSDIPRPSKTSSDFVFPVLGHSHVKRLHDHHFIPLIETPSVYYITYKDESVMYKLIMSCINTWPLLVICFMLVLLSGFIGWMMETRGNPEEFPSPFIAGWFEGIWWSFVSMTTVGYGDKVPRSIPARLFSIIWIFIGITGFSLVTAMLYSKITEVNSLPPPSMTGAKVGALRHRLYESILIYRHGGILYDIEPTTTLDGIHTMISMLENKVIDGFVLDKYTLVVTLKHFENNDTYKPDIEFLRRETIQTELTYTREQYFLGILVKNKDDYDFLADFVIDNRNVLNTCNGLLINQLTATEHIGEATIPWFSSDGICFWAAFATLATLLGLVCCYGALYELRRKKFPKHKIEQYMLGVFEAVK